MKNGPDLESFSLPASFILFYTPGVKRGWSLFSQLELLECLSLVVVVVGGTRAKKLAAELQPHAIRRL